MKQQRGTYYAYEFSFPIQTSDLQIDDSFSLSIVAFVDEHKRYF